MENSHALRLMKAATSDVHERLHVHPMLSLLLEDTLTLKHYANVLSSLFEFYKGLYHSAYKHGISCPVLLCDMERLKKDLKYLSIFCTLTGHSVNSDVCVSSYDDYLGLRYVIQGAHFGGGVIAKHLHKSLGLSQDTGAAFYVNDRQSCGPSWKLFVSHCNENCVDSSQAAKFANQVFLSLEKHLWQVWDAVNHHHSV